MTLDENPINITSTTFGNLPSMVLSISISYEYMEDYLFSFYDIIQEHFKNKKYTRL